MDHEIKLRAQDAAGELPANPVPAPAAHRGQYQFPLIEIARLVAQLAAQRDGMTLQQLQTAPCPLDPASPLVLAARGACLERGYLADGSAPRFGTGDRREGLPDSRAQFEADYIERQRRAGATDEYVFLTLQRNAAGDYSTVAVQARWEGWRDSSAR